MKLKSKTLLAGCSAILLLCSHRALGHNSYVNLVPNGSAFSCSTCHGSSSSLNRFGSAFSNNRHQWDSRLAQTDSDGDGFTNGEELGDPSGAWISGDRDPAVVVYNPGDPSSYPSTTTVGTAPLITSRLASQSASLGDTVVFSVVARGSEPLFFQWLKDGLQLPGADSETLVIAGVTSADAGRYTVIVRNDFGQDAAKAALRVRKTHGRVVTR